MGSSSSSSGRGGGDGSSEAVDGHGQGNELRQGTVPVVDSCLGLGQSHKWASNPSADAPGPPPPGITMQNGGGRDLELLAPQHSSNKNPDMGLSPPSPPCL